MNKKKIIALSLTLVLFISIFMPLDGNAANITVKGTSFSTYTSYSRSAYLQWKKPSSSLNGYQVKYSRFQDMRNARYYTASKQNIVSKTFYNLKSNTYYYFQIRTYKKVNGEKIYSTWSKKKKIKTKAAPYNLPPSDTKTVRTLDRDNNKLLILVNKKYAVSEEFYPKNMVQISSTYSTKSDLKMKKNAYNAYKSMYRDAQKAGKKFYICSAYRSYSYQEKLYYNYYKQYGKAYTDTISAYPGKSEHHTGLAIDVTSASAGWTLSQNFATTDEGKWIKNNCHKYGFIVRYPKNKTKITGYSYEPWHLRYVGKTAAANIKNKGITLEEYLGKA